MSIILISESMIRMIGLAIYDSDHQLVFENMSILLVTILTLFTEHMATICNNNINNIALYNIG